MNLLTLPFDVMLFELRRSMTLGRILLWCMLVAFPVVLIGAMITIARYDLGDKFDAERMVQPIGVAMYILIPEVICLLGLLLWATPAISTEIEGQTWVYLMMRSHGRKMVLIGKYLTAVAWTLSAALASILLCTLIVGPTIGGQLWWVMVKLSVISCFVHAALYVLIGTVFYRRTMVAAAVYTIVVEYIVSFIPAVVNKLTINYRLRGLISEWMGWEDFRSQAENIFGSEPASVHLQFLGVMTLLMLMLSLYRVEKTEYPTQQEG